VNAPANENGRREATGPVETLRRVFSNFAGRRSRRPYAWWRTLNAGLAAVACLLAAAALWGLLGPRKPIGTGAPARTVSAAPTPRDEPRPFADYSAHFSGKKLFVLPTPTETGRQVHELIAEARGRIKLMGIAEVDGRLGAYFEVDQGGDKVFDLHFPDDQVAGAYRVKEVTEDQAVLVIAGQDVKFSM